MLLSEILSVVWVVTSLKCVCCPALKSFFIFWRNVFIKKLLTPTENLPKSTKKSEVLHYFKACCLFEDSEADWTNSEVADALCPCLSSLLSYAEYLSAGTADRLVMGVQRAMLSDKSVNAVAATTVCLVECPRLVATMSRDLVIRLDVVFSNFFFCHGRTVRGKKFKRFQYRLTSVWRFWW